MKTTTAPEIVSHAQRLMLELERAVRDFPVRDRHLLGRDLRHWAQQGTMLAERAWRAQKDKLEQGRLMQGLIDANDLLKQGLQTAHLLQCFTSSGRFESLAKLASDVGKQAGGWHKQIAKHLNGQSAAASAQRQRPETLSTAAASVEAQR